jgi:hypothetical protein
LPPWEVWKSIMEPISYRVLSESAVLHRTAFERTDRLRGSAE